MEHNVFTVQCHPVPTAILVHMYTKEKSGLCVVGKLLLILFFILFWRGILLICSLHIKFTYLHITIMALLFQELSRYFYSGFQGNQWFDTMTSQLFQWNCFTHTSAAPTTDSHIFIKFPFSMEKLHVYPILTF